MKKLKSTSKPRQVLLETLQVGNLESSGLNCILDVGCFKHLCFQGELNGLRLRHPNIVRTLVIIQSSLSLDTSSAKAP